MALYFGKSRYQENDNIKVMNSGLLAFAILTILDLFRWSILIITATSVHCICKKRARRNN